MSLLTENTLNELQSALHGGINDLSRYQTVTFTQYTKQTISEDGYVFWVANLAETLTVKGSLHYGSETSQEEDQTIGINSVIFTAEEEITEFNEISITTLWVGTYQVDSGADILIAFSRRAPLYEQAGVWHYSGFAVYPALQSQLVASVNDLPVGPIVSDSLPIWLGLPTTLGIATPVYNSFLLPENIVPPYISAHVEPGMTEAVQQFPNYTGTFTSGSTALINMTSDQLTKDHVRLTFYGFTNQEFIQYYSALLAYSLNTDDFGFMSSPVVQDEKRVQSEITAIAMKKTLSFTVSYYQSTSDAIARRLILSADFNSVAAA